MIDKVKLKNLRSLMPALSNKKYFNYGGQGPLVNSSLEAIISSWKSIQELGPFTNKIWPYIKKEEFLTKKLLGDLFGVKGDHIALTENVTTGCILPILGLNFSQDDRILISDCEHPGVVSACIGIARRQNLHIDILPLKQILSGADDCLYKDKKIVEILYDKLKINTKIVIISHVLWNTGQLVPISKIADVLKNQQNQPFFVVDAAQSFCQIDIKNNIRNVDVYAFTGHKWACGPEGLGGVVLSERILQSSVPTLGGWRCLQNEGAIDVIKMPSFWHDGRRFEIATSCVPLLAGLRSSLTSLIEIGTEKDRLDLIKESSSFFWNELQSIKRIKTILNGSPPAGLVSFKLTGKNSTKEFVKLLGKKGLWIRDLEDPECLRACFHITTTREEIISLIKGIQSLL